MKLIKITGLIGLAISKEAGFIHKPLDRSHSYAAVFTALYTTWYELKEIFLAAKTCYIIAMHVTLHETSKTYSGSETMHLQKHILGLGPIKEWMNFIGRNNFVQ